MENYIQKEIKAGWNDYILEADPLGQEIQMTVQILKMSPGEQVVLEDALHETAVLVVEGKGMWSAGEKTEKFERKNQFECSCFCVHVPAASCVEIKAETDSIFYVQKAENREHFRPVFYAPDNVESVLAGDKGELGGTMRRVIRTVFDYRNAPYSKMVLGEVINGPGLWSSYPPHHHPQPEVYFYRFDKEQGFGAGFANGTVYKTGQNGVLVIRQGFHSQVTAPGYAMCYIWGIRHLEDDPWLKTRIDEKEHEWLLDEQNRMAFYGSD